MNYVVNFVFLHQFLVVSLITDVKACILAGELDLGVTQVSSNHSSLGANFLADGLGQRNTDLAIGSCDKDFLAKL